MAVRGDRQPGSVAVTGDYTLVDRKHAPDHDLLLLHILVATQVELGLQLARGRRGGATANMRKEAYSEQKASESHAAVRVEMAAAELCRCGGRRRRRQRV